MDNPRGDSSCSLFRGQIGFWNVGFCGGGKPQDPEKNLRSNTRTNNKVNPYVTTGTGIEPGPEWREARALTIAQEKEDQTQ